MTALTAHRVVADAARSLTHVHVRRIACSSAAPAELVRAAG